MKNRNEYYLGLDIGTDSVGYAVTDADYVLKKFKGEPMWGTMLFEAASDSADRRAYRVNRRRIDRRQQRVNLLRDLFVVEIGKTDPHFFIRRKESALFKEDSSWGVQIFQGKGITDKEYHKRYPTIHHLLFELMNSTEVHDVRLIYIACAWLVANRGHFLFDIPADNIDEILDFGKVYQEFREYLTEQGYKLPWSEDIDPEKVILPILQMESGVRKKAEQFKKELFGGNKISKAISETFPFSADAIVTLLSGGSVKPAEMFGNTAYAEMESVSLVMNDEDFVRIVSELEAEGELLNRLRAIKNCAQLISAMKNATCISEGKVAIYNHHKEDLKTLKYFVKKYCPEKYNAFFRDVVPENYVCYTRNVKSCPKAKLKDVKSSGKDAFSAYLIKHMKNIQVKTEDAAKYEDMMRRLEARTFLPKQKDVDNRVIPQQLYRYELIKILDHVQEYLPLLNEKDADGITVRDKIIAIFDFKIPYYVGPLTESGGENAWLVRKAQGRILPWNFEDMVDLDASEQRFIARMTNSCTYIPGESVLPANSLLYNKYTVLNELNNLKVNGRRIPVDVKQELYRELFEKHPRVSSRTIKEYLVHHGYMEKQDEIAGLDDTVKSSLQSYHIFKRLLENGALTENDTEAIIEHAAYSEDKSRMRRWLKTNYPKLTDEDVAYILKQKLKGFGRLSRYFLTGMYGTEKDSDGEAFNIIEMLWNTNENLMQLLSERYTYAEGIKYICDDYYKSHPQSLDERLSAMYVSNAVKRPIFRTLDIVQDVVKATGAAPAKIFVEMARGGIAEQKGKRTKSRKAQLMELYKTVKTDDTRRLTAELEAMGTMADNRLQDRRLFLYYLQLGKCAYSGHPIDLSRLADGTYNLDHIYPQCHVKDDSILNNLVLVESEANGRKSNAYPLPDSIRRNMQPFWLYLKKNGFMTDEKYRRLTRPTPFTPEEKQGFINRQLVETRQSTKVISALLQEHFPDTEIVYVKAGMVSEFRQEFELLKSRTVNDLHHAKDAYLNIVVGNVYHERFTKKWFSIDSDYNVQVSKIFKKQQKNGEICYWNGEADLARIQKTMGKNAVHLTRYSFCRKGGLFDQQPVKKGSNLVPLKKELPTEKYGGYNKPTASFFVLVRYEVKNKREVMIVPVNLMDAERFLSEPDFAQRRTAEMIAEITGKQPLNPELLMGGRPLKINTVFSLDGTLVTLSGKSSGGRQIIFSPLNPLLLGHESETYVKTMESFQKKRETNPSLLPDEQHDKLSAEKNLALYDQITEKLGKWPFCNIPGNQAENLKDDNARILFENAGMVEQINCLLGLIQLLNGKVNACDLTAAGGAKKAGSVLLSSSFSNWKKKYRDVRIIDRSAGGLFEKYSENLLECL